MQNSQPTLSQPFEIGPVTARNRVFLAPLSGISDLPFRQLAWRHGAGLVFTEMVASRELVTDNRESLARLRGDGINPHVVQLAGREGRLDGRRLQRLPKASGAAMIDINMGCPAKKVTGGYSGSALMRDPDHALESDRSHRQGRFCTGHIERCDWAGTMTTLNAPLIAARAEAAGIQMITIHGRTRMQFYEGTLPTGMAIARVREAVTVLLVANGDVATRADIDECLSQTLWRGCGHGRTRLAAVSPWICGELAGSDDVPPDRAGSQQQWHCCRALPYDDRVITATTSVSAMRASTLVGILIRWRRKLAPDSLKDRP
jgi:tRNA-dihydrouridine synthase B